MGSRIGPLDTPMDLKAHTESILHKIDDIIKTITTKDRLKLTQWHFEEERLISEDIQYGEFLQRDLFYQEPIREALEDATRHRCELAEQWKVVGPSFRAFWSHKMTREQREGLMITCFLQTANNELGAELRKYLLDFDYTTLLDNNGQGLLGLIENLIDQNSQQMAPALSSKLQETFNTWLEEIPGDDLVPNKTSFILALRWRCTWSRTLFACKAVETLLILWKTIAGKILNSFLLGNSDTVIKSQAAKAAKKKKQKKKRAQIRKLEIKQSQEESLLSKEGVENNVILPNPSTNTLQNKQSYNANEDSLVYDTDEIMSLSDDESFKRHRDEFIQSSNGKTSSVELPNTKPECVNILAINKITEELSTQSFEKTKTQSIGANLPVERLANHIVELEAHGQELPKYDIVEIKDLEGSGSKEKDASFEVHVGDVPELLEDTVGENTELSKTTISPVDTPLATTPIRGPSPSIDILGDDGDIDPEKMAHSVANSATIETCPTVILDTQKPIVDEVKPKRAQRVFVAVPFNLFKKKKEIMAMPEITEIKVVENDISTVAAVNVVKVPEPEKNVTQCPTPDKPTANMNTFEKEAVIMPVIDTAKTIASGIPNTNLVDKTKNEKNMALSIQDTDAAHVTKGMGNIVNEKVDETIVNVIKNEADIEPAEISTVRSDNIVEKQLQYDAVDQAEVLKADIPKVEVPTKKATKKNKKKSGKKHQKQTEQHIQCRTAIISPTNNNLAVKESAQNLEEVSRETESKSHISSKDLAERRAKLPTLEKDNCCSQEHTVHSKMSKLNLDCTTPLLPGEGLSEGPQFEHSIRRMIKRSLMMKAEEENHEFSLNMLLNKTMDLNESKSNGDIPNYGYYGKALMPKELLQYWPTRVNIRTLDEPTFKCDHCASTGLLRRHDTVFCESCSPNGTARWCDNKCRYEDTFHWKICGVANYKGPVNYTGFAYKGPLKSMKTLNWRRYWQSIVLHDYPRFDYVIFDMGPEHNRMQIKHGIVIRNQFLRVRVYALFRRAFWDHDMLAVNVLFRVIKSFVSVMGLHHITHDDLRWQFAEEFGSKVDYDKYKKDFTMPDEKEWRQIEQHLSKVLRGEGFLGIHPLTPKLPCISEFPPVPDYMLAHMAPGSYPEGGV
ncbi:hypothetical protein EDC01DRAFT_765165 [Geopyxis carbonaria]|nr:hypothetical protein EDC01DRAFT_765165 [Geopyxis carbonaria]